MAMQNARDIYTRRGEGTSIWVVPAKHISASNPDDNDMLFDPSNDKIYRHPTFYVMPEGAKNI
jgi:ring-1,2-phenylacetyl-CoA epoxidase subunit PaaB